MRGYGDNTSTTRSGAPDTVGHDLRPFRRHEQDVGLHDEAGVAIEDDVHRRGHDFSERCARVNAVSAIGQSRTTR